MSILIPLIFILFLVFYLLGGYNSFRHTRKLKILDTSVIIDGRIVAFCEVGFMDGTLIVPRFILRELQRVADSSDKKERGRRGLDIITKLSKSSKVKVVVDTREFPEIEKVDDKLVELGRITKAKLLTTDFNLGKVAQIQGVDVLNIHELATALKIEILPGEGIIVNVIKKGKGDKQGVAYFDDGTMIVIDKGENFIGKDVEVEITSTLQTDVGRMIFAKVKD